MKELILYYSFGGTTKRQAEELAEKDGAELREIKEVKKRNGFTVWIPGVFQAGRNSKTAIEPLGDLDSYDQIVLAGPIWAGNVAPAVNSAAELLPKDSKVALLLVSGSGKEYGEKLAAQIKAGGSEVIEVTNIKTGK